MKRLCLAVVVLLAVSAAGVQAQDGEPGRNADSPNPLKNVYFGEEHLHTEASPDAFAILSSKIQF